MSEALNAAPSNGYVANPVFNALVPSEGPKVITVPFDFTQASSYYVDFSQTQQSGKIQCIASCFVDNSTNADEVLITVQGTAQPLKIPPHTQGTFPLYCLRAPRITVSTSGNTLVTILFSNSTQPLANWSGLS